MDSKNQALEEVTPSTELRYSLPEFASTLSSEGVVELDTEKTLVLHQIDSSDFITAVEELEPKNRLGVLVQLMRRFSLEVNLEGSIDLGAFNLADHSWTLKAGNTGKLRITAKPTTVRKSLSDIIAFLTKIPVGQALVLKPFQELFLEDILASDLVDYYEYCQNEKDGKKREKEQDSLFIKNSPLLSIDTGAGGLLFRPVAGEELKHPRVVVGLLSNT
jgi:hypothetical protein